MSEIDSIGKLIATYNPATCEQVNEVYQGLAEFAPKSFVWIDDNINDHKTGNHVGMIVKNPKGEAVNLAILTTKPFLINHREKTGAGVLGDLGCDVAYLVDDLMTACDLAHGLKDERYCVLLAFGNIDKVAKTFCQTHRLILPIYADKAQAVFDRIGSLPNVEIHACTDPTFDILDGISEPMKGGLNYPYMGGYFVIKEGKLLYTKLNSETDHTTELFLCNALHIDGMTRDKNGGNWGKLLRFNDPDGQEKTWVLPNALLMGDSRDYLKPLSDLGLLVNPNVKTKALLTAYIQFYPCTDKLICVDSVGWHDGSYVLPQRVFGERIILQSEQGACYSEKGTLETWQEHISKPCIHHNRLTFAICVALAGAVLSPLGEESVGFHLVGASSMGKSLALQLGASVWGNRDFVRTWKATGNGMESVASLHHDNFLPLDEIGECDTKRIGDIIYMLGNGKGKQRMSKDITARPQKKWRIAYLSTGETTLEGILKQSGQTIKAGQEVRFATVNADAGRGLGMFDGLMGFFGGRELAEHLREQTNNHHGTAGVAWLDYLTSTDYLPILKSFINDFTAMYDGLSRQAGRVCRHFAIIAGAGELATLAGVTGWQAGQATQAVKVCFDDWLNTHGKYGDLELSALIERIVHTIERHQYGRMVNLKTEAYNLDNNYTDGKANLLGYIDDDLYLFTKDGLTEMSNPLSHKTAFKMLSEVELTRTSHRQQYQKKINGKRQLFYAIKDEILTFLDDEA